jgi:hypothetical protein
MELGFVPNIAPALMIAILFTSACIASGCLNVAVGNRTNPHVTIRRWYCKRFDPSELALVLDGFAVGIEIREVPASQLARYSGPRVVDVAKPGIPGGFEIEWMLDTRCLPGLAFE